MEEHHPSSSYWRKKCLQVFMKPSSLWEWCTTYFVSGV